MNVIDIADDSTIARAADVALSPAEQLTSAAARVGTALMEAQRTGSREAWLAVTAHCQHLVNSTTAVQDAAIVQVARRENIWCEDGTLGETMHSPGRVTIDAADLVAPAIGASHPQAQRRVEHAVRLAGGLVPVEADGRDAPDASGLRGLHEAMADGQLDAYRAGVVAFELEVAPAHVAEAIVAALGEHLGAEAATLRRRTRVLLERISPDLVRERARRARAATGLRRWVAEPGVDEWHGTFPSEDAASAWAAIDRLAHDLVAAGTCSNIEQARGKALTDLVTGNATVDVQIVLTVPADSTRPTADTDTARTGPSPHGSTAANPMDAGKTVAAETDTAHAKPAPDSSTAAGAIDAGQTVPAADVGSRARAAGSSMNRDASPTPHRDPSHEDLVEVQGARPSEPLLVRGGWLRDHLPKARPRPRRGGKRSNARFVPCDPLTGARLDPGDDLATDAYRPGTQLTALVRARDGRCRFPGCCVAARFCDLDHVRPWPLGRTVAGNLLTLCRRHHRIKQRPGWRVRLAPDGTSTWTDPTGRVRTTAPLDALKALVLTADAVPDRPMTRLTPEGFGAASAWSPLETHLEFTAEHHPHAHREDHRWLPSTHRRCTSAADLRVALARCGARAAALLDVPPF
jgi:hypothetical protein